MHKYYESISQQPLLTTSNPNTQDDDGRFRAPPRQLTTWVHDYRQSTDDVVVDLKFFPPGTKEGDVAELRTISHGNTVPSKQKVLFVVKQAPEELKRIMPHLQVSVEPPLIVLSLIKLIDLFIVRSLAELSRRAYTQ